MAGLRHIGNAPAALVEAFAAAVGGWRFTPVLLNGEPVAVELNAEATFVP